MTITPDADDFGDPAFWDDSDLRAEIDRAAALCSGCRRCTDLCPSFVTLFALVDAGTDGADVALTAAQQDRVVDGCHQCKLCAVGCPYTPPHDAALHFPRLMARATFVRSGGAPVTGAAAVSARADLTGIAGGVGGALTVAALRPGGRVRRAMQATMGVDARRLVPPYARQRFTTWWRLEGRDEPSTPGGTAADTAAGDVTVFPGCAVEYRDPDIGKAVVRVLRRHGCDVACNYETCCGVPDLEAGDAAKFVERARRTVDALAPEVRAGRAVVVPSPTCAYAMRHDYPAYLRTDAARAVAEAVVDPAGYLSARADAEAVSSRVTTPLGTVAYHASCRLRAQQSGLAAVELLQRVPGTTVHVVEGCAGGDGVWSYRVEHAATSRAILASTTERMRDVDADVHVGDCHRADVAFDEAGLPGVVHPLQALARAYGLDDTSR